MFFCRATWFVYCCALALLCCCSSTVADDDKSASFKPGDRIEAKQGSDWFAGVVVSVDKNSIWVGVQLDDNPDFMKGFSEDVRTRALKTSVPQKHLRRPAKQVSAKPNKQAVAKPTAQPTDAPATPPKPGFRTWKDRTGKFNVTATYQGLNDGKVVLESENGKRIEVPLSKLSDDDAKFVASQQNKDDGNPFEDIVVDSIVAAAAAPVVKATPKSKPVKVKRSSPKVIELKTNQAWTYKPVARQVTLNAEAFGKRASLGTIPDSELFFEKVNGLYVSDDGGQAVVVRMQGKVGDGQSYLQAVDLVAQQAAPLVSLPHETNVFDISTTENLVAFGTEHFGFGKNSTLTIARLQGDQLDVLTAWEPYATEAWEPDRDVKNAWLLSGHRVMTLGSRGKSLTVWDIDSLQALWTIPLDFGSSEKMTFGQNRRLLAIAMSVDIALIDLVAGEHVGTLHVANRNHWNEFTFSDDGMRLCGMGENGIFQLDLTTGKQTHEFSHPSMRSRAKISYAGDFILLENKYLYDINREILLWAYGGAEPTLAQIRDGRMWAVSSATHSDHPPVLTTASLPHNRAIQVAKRLGTLEQLLISKPGDAVAIKIEVDPAIAPADEVRKAIEANLTQAGYKVVDQADLLVTAVCQRKDQQTIKINTGTNQFNPKPEEIVERTITPHASFITMTLRGEKVWENGYVATPGFTIFLEQNETLDQALARLTSPNINLIKNTKFSTRMTRPGTATRDGAYGTSDYATSE